MIDRHMAAVLSARNIGKMICIGNPEPANGIPNDIMPHIESADILDLPGAMGCTIPQDLSLPLYPENTGRVGTYDTLFDCGAIEHVSNPCQCLTTYASLLKPHGRIVIVTTTDSQQLHGFFQFNPSWFYEVLRASGFAVVIKSYAAHRWGEPIREWPDQWDPRYMRIQFPRLLLIEAIGPGRTVRSLTWPIQPVWKAWELGLSPTRLGRISAWQQILHIFRHFITHLR